MKKNDLIKRLDGLMAELKELRRDLANDPEDNIRYPDCYSLPVTELHLYSFARPQQFYNICNKHRVYTLGQLIEQGRATVDKWPGIGGRMVNALKKEIKDRWLIDF